MKFIPIFYWTILSLEGLAIFMMIISIFCVTMVLLTQERNWKNYTHISWFNAIILVIILITLAGCFSISLLFFVDTCAVDKIIEDSKSTKGFNKAFPAPT
jgi:fumarate reductase subunit C